MSRDTSRRVSSAASPAPIPARRSTSVLPVRQGVGPTIPASVRCNPSCKGHRLPSAGFLVSLRSEGHAFAKVGSEVRCRYAGGRQGAGVQPAAAALVLSGNCPVRRRVRRKPTPAPLRAPRRQQEPLTGSPWRHCRPSPAAQTAIGLAEIFRCRWPSPILFSERLGKACWDWRTQASERPVG